EPDALEQPEEIELALRVEIVQHLVGGKVLDPDHQVLAQRAKTLRQPAKRRNRQHFQLLQRRRLDAAPSERIGDRSVGHAAVVACRRRSTMLTARPRWGVMGAMGRLWVYGLADVGSLYSGVRA